jgi:hypothetical protein
MSQSDSSSSAVSPSGDSPLPAETTATNLPASDWPPQALDLAVALHQSLQLGDRQWHALKHQKGRRGAEQISAALVQLLHDPQGPRSGDPERRAMALALLEQGLSWLKGELKDPGCPTHGR